MAATPRLVLVLVLDFLAGCDRTSANSGAPAAGPATRARRSYSVVVETARLEHLAYRIETVGELIADEEVQVAAEVEGVLGPLTFREGDRVTPATVLVEVDPIRFRLAVERQEAALAKSGADLREKEAALAKRASLHKREAGWVPEEEMLRFEAEVAEALAAQAEADAQLKLARHDLERSRVRPPIAGDIERRLVNAGQWVGRGTGIATIVKRRPLRLSFTVTEEESAHLRLGAVVQFRVPAYGREEFPGTIFFVSGTANPRTRRIEGLAQVPNDDERLKPGFFARVALDVSARDDAILVPETAVIATEDGFVAYVVEGGIARRRVLETGLRTAAGKIEVRNGIKAGESVVVRGAGLLQDGVTAAIEEAAPGPR